MASTQPKTCPKCSRPWTDHTRAYAGQEPPLCCREARFDNIELTVRNDPKTTFAEIDICYPRSGPLVGIELGIQCVRAADTIRITYDFDRDGYSILQASNWDNADEDKDWQEVAFVQAWARERTPPEEEGEAVTP
jgi:hypothetical protein